MKEADARQTETEQRSAEQLKENERLKVELRVITEKLHKHKATQDKAKIETEKVKKEVEERLKREMEEKVKEQRDAAAKLRGELAAAKAKSVPKPLPLPVSTSVPSVTPVQETAESEAKVKQLMAVVNEKNAQIANLKKALEQEKKEKDDLAQKHATVTEKLNKQLARSSRFTKKTADKAISTDPVEENISQHLVSICTQTEPELITPPQIAEPACTPAPITTAVEVSTGPELQSQPMQETAVLSNPEPTQLRAESPAELVTTDSHKPIRSLSEPSLQSPPTSHPIPEPPTTNTKQNRPVQEPHHPDLTPPAQSKHQKNPPANQLPATPHDYSLNIQLHDLYSLDLGTKQKKTSTFLPDISGNTKKTQSKFYVL